MPSSDDPGWSIVGRLPFSLVVGHKDVVVALLEASSALSGLVLVFLGLVITAYTGLERPAPRATLRPYRRVGGVLLSAFLVGLVCVTTAAVWLVNLRNNDPLYYVVLSFFFLQVVALAAATAWALREVLWN